MVLISGYFHVHTRSLCLIQDNKQNPSSKRSEVYVSHIFTTEKKYPCNIHTLLCQIKWSARYTTGSSLWHYEWIIILQFYFHFILISFINYEIKIIHSVYAQLCTPTMQATTNLFNPLHHVHMKNFQQYVKGCGGKLCAGVLDANGKFHVVGDRAMMLEKLQSIATNDRRISMEWVPRETDMPKLPMPLRELVRTENQNKMKQCASAFVHHFLGPDQQIGKVCLN